MTLSKAAIEELVSQAQAGDEQAFSGLFDHFYPKIFRYIRARVSNDEAEDLTADVFLKVVKKIKTYKVNSFSAWLFQIAHNRIIDYYRRHHNTDSLSQYENEEDGFELLLPDTELGPNESLKTKEDSQSVRNLLKQLNPLQQEIMELKFLEDFNNKEISLITGQTEGNIRIVQMRALRDLRRFLHQNNEYNE